LKAVWLEIFGPAFPTVSAEIDPRGPLDRSGPLSAECLSAPLGCLLEAVEMRGVGGPWRPGNPLAPHPFGSRAGCLKAVWLELLKEPGVLLKDPGVLLKDCRPPGPPRSFASVFLPARDLAADRCLLSACLLRLGLGCLLEAVEVAWCGRPLAAWQPSGSPPVLAPKLGA